MVEIKKIPPVEWFDGRVDGDGLHVTTDDGKRYLIHAPEREDLCAGDRVKFCLARRKFMGSIHAKKVLPIP